MPFKQKSKINPSRIKLTKADKLAGFVPTGRKRKKRRTELEIMIEEANR